MALVQGQVTPLTQQDTQVPLGLTEKQSRERDTPQQESHAGGRWGGGAWRCLEFDGLAGEERERRGLWKFPRTVCWEAGVWQAGWFPRLPAQGFFE